MVSMTTSFDKLAQSSQKCEIKSHLLNKSLTSESSSIHLCNSDTSFAQWQQFMQLEANYVFVNQNPIASGVSEHSYQGTALVHCQEEDGQ